jgi:divalent metal cation (Fe/Co/Zn/Cd) transporter
VERPRGVRHDWLGIEAGSLALVALGLDSIVEIFASVVVLWDLRGTQERA